MEIRIANPSDVDAVCELLYAAGTESCEYVYRNARVNPRDFIRYEFMSGRGFYGYKNVTTAFMDGKFVAVGCLNAGSSGHPLISYGYSQWGSFVNMVLFFGPLAVWRVMFRAKQLSSVLRVPQKDEAYLCNFFVAPELRGRGIGQKMMHYWIGLARAHGCKTLWLDNDETNTKAEAFYLRMGFKVTAFKRFSGHRPGFPMTDAKEMVLGLMQK